MRYLLILAMAIGAVTAAAAAEPEMAARVGDVPTGCGPYSFSTFGDETKAQISQRGFNGAEPLQAIRYVVGRGERCHTDFSKLALVQIRTGQPGDFRAVLKQDGNVLFRADFTRSFGNFGMPNVMIAENNLGHDVVQGEELPSGLYRFTKLITIKQNGFDVPAALIERAAEWPAQCWDGSTGSYCPPKP